MGSCSRVPHMPEDIPEECELYIEGNTHAVAYANVYQLGPNIHNQVLHNDMVRVTVTK
ncbi:TNP1, partial [Trifolium medium]|nr:TNP1 [Trifolium medium]